LSGSRIPATSTRPTRFTLSQFTDNDKTGVSLVGLRLVEADFAVTNMFAVLLDWAGNTPQPMCALADSGAIEGRRHGGYGPDRTVSGYSGNINLRTRGFVAGNVYVFTVILRMTKIYAA
jgi:hypothetical protein